MMPSTMTPTDLLREEHRVILRALDLVETAARGLTAGTVLPEVWWLEIIAWLRGFADRNHHAKEETSLFPAMVKAGVPSMGGPIGVMLEEHERGRAWRHHCDHHRPPHPGDDRPRHGHFPRHIALQVGEEARAGHLERRHSHARALPEVEPGEQRDGREAGGDDRALAAQDLLYRDHAAVRCRTGPLLFMCSRANCA